MIEDKQIYDLTEVDLSYCPIWFFPMDDTVEDELTVRPGNDLSELSKEYQCIVKTMFETSAGDKYVGYIYWGEPEVLEYLKPTMFVPGGCVTFWYGMELPSIDNTGLDGFCISQAFPIRFSSGDVSDFKSISGVLEGFYYIDEYDEVKCVIL